MWQAYVSVCYDENRATVTTSTGTAALLQQRLRAAGVTSIEVGLYGRFHCECYRDDVESLISFCDTRPELQFPEASGLVLPTRSNSGGDLITQGKLHHIALRSILVEQSLWYQTFCAVHSSRLIDKGSLLVCFGLERCVPPSLMRGLGPQLIHMANPEEAKARLSVETLKLETSLKYRNGYSVKTKKPPRPVVLCFGDQMSTFIGLDRKIYDGISLLRSHLDQCHAVLESMGLSGIYPDIFQRTPIEDPVKLDTMLFATQYSCAKSWIDAGVQVAAVIGHGFGELTALRIVGALSLKDTIKIVAARANLVRDCWGTDRGSNLIVEADLHDVNKLLVDSCYPGKDRRPVTIACFNGPRSFTLAGASKAIDAVAESAASFPTMRVEKLTVANAFHSSLVEPLMAELKQLGQGVTFNEPVIPWERAIKTKEKLSSSFFADHMRNAAYFNHALQRLSKQFPSCIWLEAGSNSTVTIMASRALEPSESHFQPVNITCDDGLQNLIDTSISLWKEGLSFAFWARHPSQTYEYAPRLLPPYQLEKNKHWLELKKPQKAVVKAVAELAPQPQDQQEDLPKSLYTLIGYQDSEKRSARFRINTMTKKYEDLSSGHFVTQTAPTCPPTLVVDMAIEALFSLRPEFAASNLQPQIRRVKNQALICVDTSRAVWLDLEAVDNDFHTWDWRFVSTKDSAINIHVSGTIVFHSVDDVQADFARYVRLFGHQRCLDVLNSPNADDIIQGRNLYKMFAEIIDYGEMYRGLHKLVGNGKESAGRVIKQYTGETWLDARLSECFTQVASIWVNCMTDRDPSDMFIANGFEEWIRSPKLSEQKTRPSVWDVFAFHYHESDKAYVTDMFIFDSTSGALMEIIIGISYAKVTKLSVSSILSQLTAGGVQSTTPAAAPSAPTERSAPLLAAAIVPPPSTKSCEPSAGSQSVESLLESQASVSSMARMDVGQYLADFLGVEERFVFPDALLRDLGVVSLLSTKMRLDIALNFDIHTLDDVILEELTVKELELRINGQSSDISEVAVAVMPETVKWETLPVNTNHLGDRLPISLKPVKSQATDSVARQVVVDEYILKSTHGFTAPVCLQQVTTAPSASKFCVLVTGGTGSLGSHLVAHFAGLPNVKTIICLNRRVSGSEPMIRQRQSMESKGIKFDKNVHSKLRVFETDTAKPMLGLPRGKYENLQNTVTHVLHNAWPMSGKRPVKGFGLQFQVMRNLIGFVRDISCKRDGKVSFQFISSIATVGRYPIWSGNVNVPEERMTVDSVLSNGYGDAKFVCERMLDETLHKHPDRFRTMAVRLGQVAGSKTSGYWNPAEHLSFLIKSSQTLKALPDFKGLLSWTPVNDVAATLGDLLLADNTPHPIYHIDNPVRQPWRDMILVLADALDIPRKHVIPFDEWVKRVRNFPGSVELDNPAAKLIEFLDGDFTRMACGGLLLDTTNCREHSKTLCGVDPVSEDTARKYIRAWKKVGFLHE